MPMPILLVATWNDGLFRVAGEAVDQEFAGQSVSSLVADVQGGVLAIVDGSRLCRRSADGVWSVLAQSGDPLSCCTRIGDMIFVGTDEAHILKLDADGTLRRMTGFDAVPGRETWYAGAAVVDGILMGPPLGIRSMTATADDRVLLANVHVGGIPRSLDAGRTWLPTIAIDSDVHQVCAHPTRPDLVIAAAAAGLCVSRDAGATWRIERHGLHAPYCSAVAFSGDDILVAASTDHFAAQGAVYRRPIDADGPLTLVGGGIPEWVEGIVDTGCIATRDGMVAVIDRSGQIQVTRDNAPLMSTGLAGAIVPNGLFIA